MDVTPHELRAVELREAFRGYKQDDVDQLLDRVAGTIERLQAQVQRLSDRLAEAESEAGASREADEMLRRTLLLAQRTADAAVAEAQERARRVLSESEAHAHSIVSGAEEEARRIAIAERHRVESELRDLSNRRDVVLRDVEVLEQAARDHRRRLREFLEAEIARVDARVLPEVPQPEPEREPQPGSELEAGPDVVVDLEEPAVVDDDEDAEVPEHVREHRETDILPERRRRWRLRDAEPEPDPADDDFFDELRQAVSDETPLGPRDDEPVTHGSSFFDQDDGPTGG